MPDGLLGLAFPSLSRSSFSGSTPVFFTLVAQGVLPKNSFGLCPSELYIGGTNNELHKGDFTYVPVTHEVRLCKTIPRFDVNCHTFQGFWQANIDVLYVDGKQVAGTTDMIIDSGTSMILGDNTTVKALYDQIPGSSPIGTGGYYSSTEIGRVSLGHRNIN